MMTTSYRLVITCLGIGTALAIWGAESPNTQTDSEIDAAVGRGLDWIARGQRPDGTFGNGGQAQNTSGIWALCGMAFLARGHMPGTEPYGPVIERIITRHVFNVPGLDEATARRFVELATFKYCSVGASLKAESVVEVELLHDH